MTDVFARAIIAEYTAIAADAWQAEAPYITAILDKLAGEMRGEEMVLIGGTDGAC